MFLEFGNQVTHKYIKLTQILRPGEFSLLYTNNVFHFPEDTSHITYSSLIYENLNPRLSFFDDKAIECLICKQIKTHDTAFFGYLTVYISWEEKATNQN